MIKIICRFQQKHCTKLFAVFPYDGVDFGESNRFFVCSDILNGIEIWRFFKSHQNVHIFWILNYGQVGIVFLLERPQKCHMILGIL